MLLAEPALQAVAPTHQRVRGLARIQFCAAADKTGLADLFQTAPCRVLFPDTDRGEPAQAVLLTTSGGLTGGDSLRIEFVTGAGARATLTSQAAEKIYRALPDGGDACIDVRVQADDEAYAEWLAQETILFDGARLRRNFVADLAPTARLLAVESLVFGRAAMGEVFRSGFVHDSWRIRRGGRLIFADALRLDGDIAALRALPFGFGDARACASLIYVGDDAQALRDALRSEPADHASIAHATVRDAVLVVRLLSADAVQLRHAIVATAGTIRQLSRGLSRRLPQVWYC
jgi:urease accessory protein